MTLDKGVMSLLRAHLEHLARHKGFNCVRLSEGMFGSRLTIAIGLLR
jgi:hypothetical protein